MVKSYFEPAVRLIYAIGARSRIGGCHQNLQQVQLGRSDTGKTAASWFGSCVFLIVAATVLKSFFLGGIL